MNVRIRKPPFDLEFGLRYHGMRIAASAQTERRSGAGPVRNFLDG
jgi:hypothetical protein